MDRQEFSCINNQWKYKVKRAIQGALFARNYLLRSQSIDLADAYRIAYSDAKSYLSMTKSNIDCCICFMFSI